MSRPAARPSIRDRALLAVAGAVPRSLARHLMFLLQTNPATADGWGYHVRPIHYYEPLPDFRAISAEAANRRRVPAAVDFDLVAQRNLLTRLGARYGAEVAALADSFNFANEYFAGLDAAMYYALIRDLRPRRVIEIGAGYSTRIADRALQRNRSEGHPGELTCIEPFPAPRLTDDMPQVTLITEPVERVPLEVFDQLGANDVLFIDSSHAVKFGGDVCREFLEILPRLKPGVWIHVHDIFFPHDYPVSWLVEQRLAWTEQYLLEAFLSFNQSFAPRAALHWLWTEDRAVVDALWPVSQDHGGAGPASFWMMRRG